LQKPRIHAGLRALPTVARDDTVDHHRGVAMSDVVQENFR
jgi:hypothetical protein